MSSAGVMTILICTVMPAPTDVQGRSHGRLGGWAGCELSAVAGAFDDELVSAVGKAVKGGVGEDGVGEEPDPITHVTI